MKLSKVTVPAVVADGTRYRRCGRQKHDQDVVECPLCGFGHRHRAPAEGEPAYVVPRRAGDRSSTPWSSGGSSPAR